MSDVQIGIKVTVNTDEVNELSKIFDKLDQINRKLEKSGTNLNAVLAHTNKIGQEAKKVAGELTQAYDKYGQLLEVRVIQGNKKAIQTYADMYGVVRKVSLEQDKHGGIIQKVESAVLNYDKAIINAAKNTGNLGDMAAAMAKKVEDAQRKLNPEVNLKNWRESLTLTPVLKTDSLGKEVRVTKSQIDELDKSWIKVTQTVQNSIGQQTRWVHVIDTITGKTIQLNEQIIGTVNVYKEQEKALRKVEKAQAEAAKRAMEQAKAHEKAINDSLKEADRLQAAWKRQQQEQLAAIRREQAYWTSFGKWSSISMAQETPLLSKSMLGANIESVFRVSNVREIDKKWIGFTQTLKDVNKGLTDVEAKFNKVTGEILIGAVKTTRALDDTKSATLSWGKAIDIALQRIVQWAIATNLVYGSLHLLQRALGVMGEVEQAMIGLQKVLPADTDFKGLEEGAETLAVRFGRGLVETYEAMQAWARQYKNVNDIVNMTNASMLAAVATDIEMADSVKNLSAIMAEFQLRTSEAIHVVDTLNELSNNFRATATDVAEGLARAGSAAYTLGMDLETTASMIAIGVEALGATGAQIGTALKTAFARITNEEAAKALKSMGIDMKNLEQVIIDMGLAWDTWSVAEQTAVAKAIGGTHHYVKIMGIMQNFDRVLEGMVMSYRSQDSAAREAERGLRSFQVQVGQLTAGLQKMATSSTGAFSGIKAMVSGLGTIVNLFASLNEATHGAASGLLLLIGYLKLFQTVVNATTAVLAPWQKMLAIVALAITGVATALGIVKAAFDRTTLTMEHMNEILAEATVYEQQAKAIERLAELHDKLQQKLSGLSSGTQEYAESKKMLALVDEELSELMGVSYEQMMNEAKALGGMKEAAEKAAKAQRDLALAKRQAALMEWEDEGKELKRRRDYLKAIAEFPESAGQKFLAGMVDLPFPLDAFEKKMWEKIDQYFENAIKNWELRRPNVSEALIRQMDEDLFSDIGDTDRIGFQFAEYTEEIFNIIKSKTEALQKRLEGEIELKISPFDVIVGEKVFHITDLDQTLWSFVEKSVLAVEKARERIKEAGLWDEVADYMKKFMSGLDISNANAEQLERALKAVEDELERSKKEAADAFEQMMKGPREAAKAWEELSNRVKETISRTAQDAASAWLQYNNTFERTQRSTYEDLVKIYTQGINELLAAQVQIDEAFNKGLLKPQNVSILLGAMQSLKVMYQDVLDPDALRELNETIGILSSGAMNTAEGFELARRSIHDIIAAQLRMHGISIKGPLDEQTFVALLDDLRAIESAQGVDVIGELGNVLFAMSDGASSAAENASKLRQVISKMIVEALLKFTIQLNNSKTNLDYLVSSEKAFTKSIEDGAKALEEYLEVMKEIGNYWKSVDVQRRAQAYFSTATKGIIQPQQYGQTRLDEINNELNTAENALEKELDILAGFQDKVLEGYATAVKFLPQITKALSNVKFYGLSRDETGKVKYGVEFANMFESAADAAEAATIAMELHEKAIENIGNEAFKTADLLTFMLDKMFADDPAVQKQIELINQHASAVDRLRAMSYAATLAVKESEKAINDANKPLDERKQTLDELAKMMREFVLNSVNTLAVVNAKLDFPSEQLLGRSIGKQYTKELYSYMPMTVIERTKMHISELEALWEFFNDILGTIETIFHSSTWVDPNLPAQEAEKQINELLNKVFKVGAYEFTLDQLLGEPDREELRKKLTKLREIVLAEAKAKNLVVDSPEMIQLIEQQLAAAGIVWLPHVVESFKNVSLALARERATLADLILEQERYLETWRLVEEIISNVNRLQEENKEITYDTLLAQGRIREYSLPEVISARDAKFIADEFQKANAELKKQQQRLVEFEEQRRRWQEAIAKTQDQDLAADLTNLYKKLFIDPSSTPDQIVKFISATTQRVPTELIKELQKATGASTEEINKLSRAISIQTGVIAEHEAAVKDLIAEYQRLTEIENLAKIFQEAVEMITEKGDDLKTEYDKLFESMKERWDKLFDPSKRSPADIAREWVEANMAEPISFSIAIELEEMTGSEKVRQLYEEQANALAKMREEAQKIKEDILLAQSDVKVWEQTWKEAWDKGLRKSVRDYVIQLWSASRAQLQEIQRLEEEMMRSVGDVDVINQQLSVLNVEFAKTMNLYNEWYKLFQEGDKGALQQGTLIKMLEGRLKALAEKYGVTEEEMKALIPLYKRLVEEEKRHAESLELQDRLQKEFIDTLKDMALQLQAVFGNADLLGPLIDKTDAFGNAMKDTNGKVLQMRDSLKAVEAISEDFVRTFTRGVAAVIGKTAEALATAAGFGEIAPFLGKAAQGWWDIIFNVFSTENWEKALDNMLAGFEDGAYKLLAIFERILLNLPAIIEKIIPIIVDLMPKIAEAMIRGFANVFLSLPTMIKAILLGLAMKAAWLAFAKFVTTVWKTVIDTIPLTEEALINGIISAFKDAFIVIKDWFTTIIQGLWSLLKALWAINPALAIGAGAAIGYAAYDLARMTFDGSGRSRSTSTSTSESGGTASYTAGSSVPITYNNYINISVGAFMGNPEDARKFALMIGDILEEEEARVA